ncbi:MAG: hypothetical protein ACOYOL_04530 [Chthoniobacterales bacterium]
MITHTPRVRVLALSLVAAAFSLVGLHAQPTIYSDTVGDVSPAIGINPNAVPTLDIVKMEVSDTTNDIIFNLTVNGTFSGSTNSVDWGNFMIGVATGSTTNTNTGNGWNRPINLNTAANGGMTRWIGSWVNGGGGSQLWTYTPGTGTGGTGTNWTGPAGLPGYSFLVNTNGTSTINYTVSKASLGTTNLGDVIRFDAYSSGGGGGDSAVDSLANPNISITSWGGPYTSGGTNPIATYTLANSASLITNTVTFAVDMNVQIGLGNFFPGSDTPNVAGSFNGWTAGTNGLVLADTNSDGIYEGTFPVAAPSSTAVTYKFAINTTLESTGNRSFPVGANPAPPPLVLPTVFYNDNPGFRNVTFSVDMNVQIALGTFVVGSDVYALGSFNGFNPGTGVLLTDGDTNGIYDGTGSLGGADGAAIQYKYYTPSSPPMDNSGYETGANRSFNLGPVGVPQSLPTVFWNNQTNVPQNRPVSFSVDMTVQAANGNFNTNSGVVRIIGNFNGENYGTGNTNYNLTNTGSNIYAGQFAITGDPGATNQYKFFTPNVPPMTNNGYEVVNPNDLFENRTWVLGPSNVVQNLPLVFWSNDNGGATFTSWSQGAAPNSTNVGLYAIGGASGPTATNGIPSVTTADTNFLSITAIVRTNNPSLTVTGRTTTNLTLGWTTNGVTQSNAVDQNGVPFGTARQIFSVPRTNSSQFLGIQSTLAP